MSTDTRTPEKRLMDSLEIQTETLSTDLDWYYNRYYQVDRAAVLQGIASFHETQGIKAYFMDHDPSRMRQEFYTGGILDRESTFISKTHANMYGAGFGNYEPFLYGLLSDSPEITEWLMNAELDAKDVLQNPHFRFHQFQLVLQRDDEALQKTIEIIAKKGRKRDRKAAIEGMDFFSLLLKKDKANLEVLIEDYAKIKSVDELLNFFLAGYAVICAKLCWIRGIEVEIKNPLVPMPLMPIKPLAHYEVIYDFLRPNWEPPKQSLMDRFKQWIK